MSEEDIQFFAPEIVAAEQASTPRHIVSLDVTGIPSNRLGPFLDVIDTVAHAMMLDIHITAPGYTRVFYGWEKDIWNERQ